VVCDLWLRLYVVVWMIPMDFISWIMLMVISIHILLLVVYHGRRALIMVIQ
jgi:hypothetical protein